MKQTRSAKQTQEERSFKIKLEPQKLIWLMMQKITTVTTHQKT